MRILFISTFYPPYIVGGWEQLVEEIDMRLRERGHQTRVLTSRHGVDSPSIGDDVERTLTLESDLQHYEPAGVFGHKARTEENRRRTREAIERFKPDVVFVHIMWNLSRAIPWTAEQMLPGRVVYYVADHWLYSPDTHEAYWTDPAKSRLAAAAKSLAAKPALWFFRRERAGFPLEHRRVLCVSQAILESIAAKTSVSRENLRVVHNGIETARFLPRIRTARAGELEVVYAGSLIWHKGVHTILEALALLGRDGGLDGVHATIVGSGHPDYEARLRSLVEEHRLHESVRFAGRVDRDDIPELFRQFDALILSSTWDEPLARVTQEAMAAGLAVIGTLTGGTGEILKDGETGLAFGPGDAAELADRIRQLKNDPELVEKLAANGRRLVLEQFDLRRTIDEIESELGLVAQGAAASAP